MKMTQNSADTWPRAPVNSPNRLAIENGRDTGIWLSKVFGTLQVRWATRISLAVSQQSLHTFRSRIAVLENLDREQRGTQVEPAASSARVALAPEP
jgi:hypothetical protein